MSPQLIHICIPVLCLRAHATHSAAAIRATAGTTLRLTSTAINVGASSTPR